MRRTVVILLSALPALAAVFCAAARSEDNSHVNQFGDFGWMHGANYTPSYAATDVETWLHYDPAVIDHELGYAEQVGLNCVRVFLQSLVYEHLSWIMNNSGQAILGVYDQREKSQVFQEFSHSTQDPHDR